MLLGRGLVGLRGPEVQATRGALVAWGGGGFGVTPDGLALGDGSGLDSSVSAGTAGWTSDLAAGRRLTAPSAQNQHA